MVIAAPHRSCAAGDGCHLAGNSVIIIGQRISAALYTGGVRAWWSLVLVGCAFRPNLGASGDGGRRDGGTSDGDLHADAADVQPPMLADKATQSGTTDSVTATLTGSASVGDALVVLVTWSGAATLSSVADSRATTFNTFVSLSGSLGCQLMVAHVDSVTVPDHVTATFSSAVTSRITVADYTGVPPSGQRVDGSAAIATASNSLQVSASIDTAVANDTLVAIVNSAATPTAGSGFTAEDTTSFSLLEDRVAATPGMYDAGATFTSSNSSCLGLIAIEGAD